MSRTSALATRWLGVGLTACLSVTTIALWLTGRIALYINPDSAWFAVGMAFVALLGSVATFALPLGAEADHGHDHEHGHAPAPARARREAFAHADHEHTDAWDAHDRAAHDHLAARPRLTPAGVAAFSGGLLASGAVIAVLLTPPASLSAELAVSRDVGAPPLFAGSDVVTLAASGDTSTFGIGDWSAIFAHATNPETFDGKPVTLTGFITPGEDGATFDLTRLVITHCVIDAQTARLPITASGSAPSTGQWVTVTGTVRSTGDGALEVRADQVATIDEPADPYEY
ncbi:TIGR03943 family protein [Microbacterium sp. ACRRU]|uniref:TIGR03943 family putative permease subunit n=1 Tax=Microbacterium sp. ACRRU TaxID=2918204 RepID=UPI001EF53ACC|nr:TIGR03943 family protein [Microbacterium sp. ACRRU]MCG7418294.1 TIGR03943 family protein [Microbacterium sp. ACRRU]